MRTRAQIVAALLSLGIIISGTVVVNTQVACEGTQVPSGANLHTAVGGKSGTFCLAAGTYNLGSTSLKTGTGATLIGATGTVGSLGQINAPTKIVGTATAAVITAASGTTLRWLDITGSRPGNSCIPNCGRGVSPGSNVTVEFSRIHDNSNQALGGAGAGLIVRSSELDRNGPLSGSANGCCSGGVKSVNGFSVLDSYVHHNIGNGIWCDRECPGSFLADGNLIEANVRSGIAYEVSGGPAVVSHNVIRGNNTERANDKGGLKITASKNLEAFGNTFRNNFGHSIRVGGKPRLNKPAGDGRGYVIQNIYLHDNDLGGHAITGCNLAGVTCTNNF